MKREAKKDIMSWDFKLFRSKLKAFYKKEGRKIPEEIIKNKDFSVIDAVDYCDFELVWDAISAVMEEAESFGKKMTHEFKEQVYIIADTEVTVERYEPDYEDNLEEPGKNYYWRWLLDCYEIRDLIASWHDGEVRLWINLYPGDDIGRVEEIINFYKIDLQQTAKNEKEIEKYTADFLTGDSECIYTVTEEDIKPLKKINKWIKKHYDTSLSVLDKIERCYYSEKPDATYFNNMVLDLYAAQYYMEKKEGKKKSSKYGTGAVEKILKYLGTSIEEVAQKAEPHFKNLLIKELKSNLKLIDPQKNIPKKMRNYFENSIE